MTPLQSPLSVHAQFQECIVQSQRTVEWSQEMIAVSKEKMVLSAEKRRLTRIRIRRAAGCHKRFKLPSETRAPIGLRFFALEL